MNTSHLYIFFGTPPSIYKQKHICMNYYFRKLCLYFFQKREIKQHNQENVKCKNCFMGAWLRFLSLNVIPGHIRGSDDVILTFPVVTSLLRWGWGISPVCWALRSPSYTLGFPNTHPWASRFTQPTRENRADPRITSKLYQLVLGFSNHEELKERYKGITLKQIEVNEMSEYMFRYRCI